MAPRVRLYGRNTHDLTARLSAIASAARRIKAKSFTIDGEAYQGLTVCRYSTSCADGRLPIPRSSTHLIERDGEDMHSRPFLDRKTALARLLRN
jgi:hypothetical protein